MAAQITNYQCPACTAPLQFGAGTGKLQCEYCLSSFTVEEIELQYGDANAHAAEAKPDAYERAMRDEQWGEDAEKMRFYSCPACGAELICDETTAATSCPYCSNPTIVPGQFTGVRRPDYVIPFELTKEDAIKALKNHCKGKVLLPKNFRDEHHVQEIKGVYVPFWLFDGAADVDVKYTATRSTRVHRGDNEIITTHHYAIHRAGDVRFNSIPVDGSTKMPDEYMDAIEPYDYGALKPFAMAYLPGFLADKFDVDADKSFLRAQERIRNSAYDSMRETVGFYETVVPISSHAEISRGDTRYALMPVWMLNTKYRGKDYLFAVNGQTGKAVGELPVSWGRFCAWFAGISAGLAALASTVLLYL